MLALKKIIKTGMYEKRGGNENNSQKNSSQITLSIDHKL